MASFATLEMPFASSFGQASSSSFGEQEETSTLFAEPEQDNVAMSSALFAQEEGKEEEQPAHDGPAPARPVVGFLERQSSLLPCEANADEKNRAMLQVYEGE